MAVGVVAEALPGGPAPKAGVTVNGLGVGDSVVTVWRSVDDERAPVRGARRIVMNDAGFVTDWDAPINRPVTYEVEVLSGPGGPARASAAAITVVSATGWLMDPFVPQNAVPVVAKSRKASEVSLQSVAMAELEYAADVSLFNVMGSNKPLALFGERMAARGVDLSMATMAASESKKLKDLLRSSPGFLFRPGPELDGLHLEAAMFLAAPTVSQAPVDVQYGGELTWWGFKADTVAAPTINVLTATFTYGDVQLLTASYQQKQDAMAGKTYLDDLKNPLS